MEDRFYPDEFFDAAEKAHKELSHEEMLEIAEEREVANKAAENVKKFMEEQKEELQQLAELETLERQDRINNAHKELDAIVLGGQNMREFLLSILYIRNTLESLKDDL